MYLTKSAYVELELDECQPLADGGRGRDAANVVLYEDAAKARLQGFLNALEVGQCRLTQG
jgi:hypothetical protein